MLSRLFNRAAPAASDELRAALVAIDLATLEAAVAAADVAYRGTLLDDDEAATARADDARRIAQRELDRGIARRTELEARLAETEAAERRAAPPGRSGG